MNVADYPDEVEALCELCHLFGDRGWCRATSGNFSLRIDGSHCLMTQSGCDKSRLTGNELMLCDLSGQALDPDEIPSAETPVHSCLYRLSDSIGAVFHSHSVTSTLLSMRAGSALEITGFEMQKAFTGVTTHEQTVVVPVFDNDQDMVALAEKLAAAWHDGLIKMPGFLIAGHGLYAWGDDAAEATRHVEGFEFLFECLWQEQLAKLS